ncbi:acyl-CoA synthetase [Limnohabitans sp.]|uniref:acyl-CoA synthetase n=1 Tax=Limnohabitans sp. TaxID=1907725 RepID=UPI0039BC9F92|nr:AMP-binding protein [Comamonadaceae bacterium]
MKTPFPAFDYEAARADFSYTVPEFFNFGFDVVDKRAQTNDKLALIAIDRSGQNVTHHHYSDLERESNRFANALLALGVGKGDSVLVVLPRIAQWYFVLLGCAKIGAIAMPGTNQLKAKDLEYRVNRSGASVAVVGTPHAQALESIESVCPSLQHKILVGDTKAGWHSYEDMCATQPPTIDRQKIPRTRSDECMLIYFTSGTTSLPKMVERDHAYALAHSITGRYWQDLRESDVHWTLTDTGWAKAAWGLLYPPLTAGATIVLYDGEGFDLPMHLDIIAQYKVSTFCAPPTVYRVMAKADLSGADFSSLRHCFGAGEPLNPEAMRAWKLATGCDIYDGYGQTETINIVANFPGMAIRPGSMGKPCPGLHVDVINDDGQVVADGEVGHIAVKVTDPHPPGLFRGYYGDPQTTAKSFRHGWYYTGDTAKRDPDGYIWFVGRSDDIISSSSYRISPFEVESTLIEHPAVAEAAVIGKPDELRGEIVKAFIILAKGYTASEALAVEIQNFVKAQTAPYKYPREIEFRDTLPKTISGKIRRVELRGEN